METLLNKLAEHGITGIMLAIALWALWNQQQKNSELQTKLVQAEKDNHKAQLDSVNAAHDREVALLTTTTQVIAASTTASQAHAEALKELKEAVKDAAEIRSPRR